jgi:ankyrin repeat protein
VGYFWEIGDDVFLGFIGDVLMTWVRHLGMIIAMVSIVAAAYATTFGGKSATEAFPGIHGLLVQAAIDGDTVKMERLVKEGADPNYRGVHGIPPLLWLMGTRSYRGMAKLLELGADPNAPFPDGTTPTWKAAWGKDTEVLRIILDHGGNPNGPPHECTTALMTSLGSFEYERIDLLLAHGADINGNACNYGAANIAAIYGRFDMVLYLLSKGYSFDLSGLAKTVNNSLVPKNSAAYQDKQRVLEILREKGAKIPPLRQ